MADDLCTLVLVPSARTQIRTVRVSLRRLKAAFIVIAVAAVVMPAILAHYVWLRIRTEEARRLKAENAVLRVRTTEYEAATARLESRVEQLQRTVTGLGLMTGLETNPPFGADGVGGVSARDVLSPRSGLSLRQLDTTITELTERSVLLESRYRDQKELLASTPSVWPVHGYLTATFGNRVDPFTGHPDFHPGVDISNPSGAEVKAPADAQVTACGENGGYGNNVVLDHGHDVVTRFGHLSSYSVTPGQRVRRGDVIGHVGTSGRSTGPHLHYEVWVHDRAVNPLHYIIEEYRAFE